MPTSPKKPWAPPNWSVLGPVCALIVLLNLFDALATIEIISRGGEEANPFARAVLGRGDLAFLAWKIGLSSVCAVALACLARYRRAAWLMCCMALAAYSALAVLHVYLLFFIRHP